MAKDWRRPNEAARKHWKQRDAGETSTAARGVQRLVFTLLSLVLVGVLIYFLIPRGQKVYVAYLSEDYGPPLNNPTIIEVSTLPPPMASEKGVYDKEFATLGKRLYPKQFTVADIAASGNSKLAAKELVDSLTAPLKDKWNLASLDFLVLYINAHGIAIDGEPYLMWNEDYALELGRKIDSQSQSELMKLSDVIEQIRALPAKQKLLVLDSGRIFADPRLGFFVNEFPQLAEEKINATKDSTLWAFTSHSVLEQSHVFEADRTSVFGHFIRKGIAGASRQAEDEDLMLRDFVQYVTSEVYKTVTGRTGQLQTPKFLNGQLGTLTFADIPEKTFLKSDFFDRSVDIVAAPPGGSVWSSAFATLALAQNSAESRPTVPPTAGAAQPAVTPPAAPPTTPPTSTNPPATTPPAAAPPTIASPPTASPAPAPPVAEPKSPPPPFAFDKVWELVNEIEDPGDSSDTWSPVDYAPHRWAQLRRQLVWYETMYALESDARKENSAFIEADIIAPLKHVLLRAGDQETAQPKSLIDVFSELQRARAAFRSGAAYASAADTNRPAMRNFIKALRLKNYLTYRVTEEVRHYGYFPDPSSARHDNLEKLIQVLSKITLALETQAKSSLDEAYWLSNPPLLKDLRDANALLGTDDLQRDLIKMGTVPAESIPNVTPAKPKDIKYPQPAKWVDLHLKLARLTSASDVFADDNDVALIAAAGKIDSALGEQVRNLRKVAVNATPLADENEIWKAYRALGLQVRAYFDGLDDNLRRSTDTAHGYEALCKFERQLRLVDGRDAAGMSPRDNPIAQREICPRIAPHVEIVLADKNISLPPPSSGRAGGKVIAPSYRWNGEPGVAATVHVEFDNGPAAADIVKVTGSPADFKLQAEGTLPEIIFEQAATRARKTNSELVSFRLVVSVGNKDVVLPGSGEMVVAAHGRELVDLAAYRVRKPADLSIDSRTGDVNAKELREPRVTQGDVKPRLFHLQVLAFPNRPDQYRFKLNNVSGAAETRQVAVDLFEVAIPPETMHKAFDERGELDTGFVRELPQFHQDLTLTANTTLTFPFIQPPPPMPEGAAKPADAPAAAPPAAAAEKPKAPPPIADFRHGMVFRITDQNNADLRWYYWVDFRARWPGAYVESKVTYDSNINRGRLDIILTPREGTLQPLDGFSASWTADGVKIAANGKMEVTKKQQDEIRLHVNSWFPPEPARGKFIPLFISVDGYPRAIVHEFTPAVAPGVLVKTTGSFQRVKIVNPARDLTAYEKTKPGEVRVNIGVELDGQPPDLAVVQFNDGNNSPWETKRWRAEHVLLEEKGWDKDGVLTLTTTAGDYVGADAIPFDTAQSEEVIPVNLELKLGDDTLLEDRTRVIVDTEIPSIEAMSDPNPRTAPKAKGLAVTVTPTVNDPGGIAKIEFFILPDSKDRLLEEEQAKPDFVWTPPAVGEDKIVLPIVDTTPIPVKVPIDKAPGQWAIWAVAVNQVNRRSLPVRTTNPFDLEEAKKDMPKEEGPGVTITGFTTLYDKPVNGMSVQLVPLEKGKGKPQSSATVDPTAQDFIDNAGPYRFEKVQPGKYKITAKGSRGANAYAGEIEVAVEEGESGEQQHDIKLLKDR